MYVCNTIINPSEMKTQAKIKGHSFLWSLFSFLLLFSTTRTSASFRFTHYDIENNLPSNTIRSIIQDSNGFMWFGTENGLSRFDGYQFKTFRTKANDSTSIGNNYIYSLLEDDSHNFWIGTDKGLYLYHPEKEQFSKFNQKTDQQISIQSNVSSILTDKSGNIWFGTLGQGVFVYNPKKQSMRQYLMQSNSPESLVSNNITYLFCDSQGRIWVTNNQSGQTINYFDPVENKMHAYRINTKNPDTSDYAIYAIVEDLEQNIWMGSWNKGLCKLNTETGESKYLLSPENKHGTTHIHSLMFHQPNVLLIGSDDGLTSFNIQTLDTELITSTEFKDQGLSSKFVYPIYKDKEGAIWVGTYYGGVNYSAPTKGTINGYTHSQYRNSVGGNIVSCFTEDTNGNIWIGSDDGGLSHFNVKTKLFTNYLPDKQKNSLSYHNIHALCLDENKLWIGTYTGGLNVMDIKTKQFKLYSTQLNKNSIKGNSVYSIYKDSDKAIWIGSMSDIYLFNRQTDDFSHMQTIGTTTVQIIEDKKKNLWFATWGKGLYRYNKVTGEWSHFVHDSKQVGSLSDNQINGLDIDKYGNLWIGCDNGVCKFDTETECFTKIAVAGNQNSIVYNITCVNDHLWLGTINGLIVYHPETKWQRTFYKVDGLQSDQFSMKANLLASDGNLYVGTINGFNVINPNSFTTNKYIPPVKLTNLQIFNKDISINEKGILRKSITIANGIELTHKENVFSIEYAALSYNAPAKNQYKYKLENFDKEWNLVGNQRKATYTNLPAGKYIFHVVGSNNDGIWNEEGTSLKIIIHPPLWRSSLAYMIYFISIIGLFLCILHYSRQRTEKRHKEKIRQFEIDKEKELYTAKINFFTLLAHEIRTPVSLIIGPLEKIMEQSHSLSFKTQEDLSIINRNSQRLLSLVNQLLDFRKAEQGLFVVHFSRQNIGQLLTNVYVRFKPLVEQKGITFELQVKDPETTEAFVDEEAITKVISNLLTNASKYAKDCISITCTANESSVIIQITDNGCGISKTEQKHIFQAFYQATSFHRPGTGIGLALVKLLMNAHHGQIEVESKEHEFTTFTVVLPKHQKNEIVETNENVKEKRTIFSETNLVPEAEQTKQPDIPAGTTTENKPILLIIDDNTDMRKFLCESFTDAYQVITAENGKEALDRLKKQQADLMICDIMMPIMDGLTFCKEVKANVLYSHIPLILLTAKTDNESKIAGMKMGADAYIEKPFSIGILRAQLENLLESRKSLRKKFSEMPFVPLKSIAGNKADELFLTKINELIEKNFSNSDFSVDMLAEQLCVSRSSLFVKIKDLAGMTPNELIQIVRLKKAAELLVTQTYRINEICYQVGFNNPSYFSKCFQKQFGILPKDFINKPI